ncbi:MAG TPA: hypothetical protein VHV32_08360 [Candidatus Angelobacter sp.]|nr:hypothetical protein [Candidatus Angelobacter sp.]
MKSYWIAAAVFFATVWPGSKTHAIFAQTSADNNPVQHAQSSQSSASLNKPVQASIAVDAIVPATNTTAPAAAPTKPKGSYMLVELSKGLKAKKLKVGDKVKAQVSQDVVAHGKVIIPVETKLIGHVTEVNSKDSTHPESRLGIVFDRILLKHFHDIDFEAVVQAVSQPVIRRSLVDQPSQMLPPSMMGGMRSSLGPAGSRGSSNQGRGGNSGAATSASLSTIEAPVTIKESQSTNAESSGSLLEVTSSKPKPMSIGMPQGVFGLKGLSLSAEPSPNTPGPVIVSNSENVKLDSGTQILLHVLKVEMPENVEPQKKSAN